MTAGSTGARSGFLDRWCGWVLALGFALTPLLGWLGPLGFAALMSLVGLLTLPGLRISEPDRPIALAIVVMVIWAAGSMLWSPFEVDELWSSNAAKLASQAVLYWAAYCAARRLDRAALTRVGHILMWGTSALSVMLIAEAVTGAAIYQQVRIAIGDPIRPDLAMRNVAQGVFVLSVLAAPAALAAIRLGWWQLAVLMAAAIVAGGVGLGADAPVIALPLAVVAAAALWRWPKTGPRVMAAGAAIFFLTAPLVVWAARAHGVYGQIQDRVTLSWSMRMDYWSFAIDWISDKPLRGWGLDASRMFGPGIKLHPHNAALQVWLELGVIGAAAATVLWAGLFLKLERRTADLGAMAGAATAVTYLAFAAVSFGVWQEWWLALGALAVVSATAAQRLHQTAPRKALNALRGARPSTSRPISE